MEPEIWRKKIDVGQTRARDFCRTSDPGWQLKIRNCQVSKSGWRSLLQ
jgi:hypothetical protein